MNLPEFKNHRNFRNGGRPKLRILTIEYGCGHSAPVRTGITSPVSEQRFRENALKTNCGACADSYVTADDPHAMLFDDDPELRYD